MQTIEKKSVSVGKFASKQEVDTLIRGYKQERWVANSEHLGKEDALSGWLTVEELERYIETVKMHGGNGVRFHFGIFPEGYSEDSEFEGRQTFVMVGTRSKDATYHTSKELRVSDGINMSPIAYFGAIPCPALCGDLGLMGEALSLGTALVEGSDKGLSVI
ncbi:MAG TPA: hypothetical protein VK563_04000 [Puia sp.]|nr:hypothetical protein [Puia sp.]